MGKVFSTSRDIAKPVVDALRAAFQLDELGINIERRNAVDDVAVWYAVSILSHPEVLRLQEIADATHAKIAVLPLDASRLKVELRVSAR